VYLPEGGWYRFSTGEFFEGAKEVTVDAPLHDLPVFVKASGIIPMQSVIRHTSEKPSPALELHVYAGTKPNIFHYYEDDGATYAYESGTWYKRDILYDPINRTIRLTAVDGSHSTRYTSIRFVLHGFEDTMTLRTADGEVSLKLRSATEKTAEIPFGAGELVVGY
jgi:alpha-glucosidase